MNDLKWCLYYTLTTGGHKDIYYIDITENDSTLKAKNLLSKTVFTALIDAMHITDQAMINDNKSALIKGIKNSIYESDVNTLNYNNEYNVIEVTGDIKKTTIKTETIQKRVNDNGVIKLIDCEGIKYNSKLYPNLDLYIVKNENRAHRYHLIEKSSGLALITNMKSKQADAIENILASYNMTEKKVIDNFTTLITGKCATSEERKAMETNNNITTVNNSNNSTVKADDINIIDNTTSTTDSTTNDKNTTVNTISNAEDKSYIVGNRCFNTRLEAETYCNEVDFDYSMIIEQTENDNKKVVVTDELEKSQLCNRTIKNLQGGADHEKSYTDKYKQQLETLRVNTIKRYTHDLQSNYIKYFDNLDYYNKKYSKAGKYFFKENNISSNEFFNQLNQYRFLKMLKNLNVDNIIFNFKKYWITENQLNDRINGHYGGYKPIFNMDMLYNIKEYLFNNDNNMLSLFEQNEKMHSYVHFDAGMKRIKAI